MSILGVIRRIRPTRLLALTLLAAVGVAAMGARCIEKPYVYVDGDGYTHITGRMVNDTDIQGAAIMLRGTLYDANNNVLATKDAPICPPDLKPYGESMFDIRFDNPGIPPHTRFTVQAISGVAMSEPKANPDVVLFSAQAIRFENIPFAPGILPFDSDDVIFGFDVRNRSNNTYPIQGCSAVFDSSGNIVNGQSVEIVQFDENFGVSPATLGPQEHTFISAIARDVARGPVQVRAWLWFGRKGDPTSQWQYVETNYITIVTENF